MCSSKNIILAVVEKILHLSKPFYKLQRFMHVATSLLHYYAATQHVLFARGISHDRNTSPLSNDMEECLMNVVENVESSNVLPCSGELLFLSRAEQSVVSTVINFANEKAGEDF
jgi:hypothetical protein